MVVEQRSETIEDGEISFFYRPRTDARRFYMALAARRPRPICRLFELGRTRLPEVEEDAPDAEARVWALNIRTSPDPDDIRRLLHADKEAARELGEGRYLLVRHRDHTDLVYELDLPTRIGPAQRDFEILREASYVVSVVDSARRRIVAAEPRALDHEGARLLLLSPRARQVEDLLGVEIDAEEERRRALDLGQLLRMTGEPTYIEPLAGDDLPETE